MSEKDSKIIRGFVMHGVELDGHSGNQRYGECPFCGKENKFYVNEENGLWDCKVCGLKGNQTQFLERICSRNIKQITDKQVKLLAEDRELPEAAFKGVELGFDGSQYTMPVRDVEGHLIDLRVYKIGSRLMGTGGCKVGLWNSQSLKGVDANVPVYICEGEWDGIALMWLAKSLKKRVLVVASPGANTFKKDWISAFNDRKVYCLYDHDAAGEEGQLVIQDRLNGVARSIGYIHWPDVLSLGFDVRDLITRRAVKKERPEAAWKRIHVLIKSSPVRQKEAVIAHRPGAEGHEKEVEIKNVRPIKFQKVLDVIKKWLLLKNTDAIEVATAAMLSNKLGGDLLWMFLVGPPGSAKTEVLSTLSKCPESYFTSSLTPQALISGGSSKNGIDPSLIPKLDQKVLIVKDFTTILTKREQERDEIFGILRDAYDGNCSKVFGTGDKKSYISKFSIISAVTPKIYELAETHQSLGERFLKFCVGHNLEHESEQEVIQKAISNLAQEDGMRTEMADAMAHFIAWKIQSIDLKKLPTIPLDIQKKTIALAQFGARMRGTVARDKYRPDMVQMAPSAEVGSRLGKQLAKLLVSLAIVNDRKEVNENDYRLAKKCMLDTIPQRTEMIVREMLKSLKDPAKTTTVKLLSRDTRFPQTTIARQMADLDLLRIAEKHGLNATKYEWGLSAYIRELVARADLYTAAEELNRESVGIVRPRFVIKKTP